MIAKEDISFLSKSREDQIHASIWLPELSRGEKPKCILQIIHGMQEYIERYDELAKYFAKKGFVVCGEDHLGHGKSVENGGTYGYFCEKEPEKVLVEDSHSLTMIMKNRFPSVPYVVLGHSFGSFITREYISRFGNELNAVIVQGTGYPNDAKVFAGKILAHIQFAVFGGYHRASLLNKIAFSGYLSRIKNAKTSSDWICTDDEIVSEYIKDPLCTFIFTVNGFLTMSRLLESVNDKERMALIPKTLPILVTAGKEDPVGGYGKQVESLYNVYKNEIGLNAELKLYDNMRHEIHNEIGKEKVFENHFKWICEKANIN